MLNVMQAVKRRWVEHGLDQLMAGPFAGSEKANSGLAVPEADVKPPYAVVDVGFDDSMGYTNRKALRKHTFTVMVFDGGDGKDGQELTGLAIEKVLDALQFAPLDMGSDGLVVVMPGKVIQEMVASRLWRALVDLDCQWTRKTNYSPQ